MNETNRLTWNKPNGTWGLKHLDIKEVPKKYYGLLYKLHNYEKTGLSPDEVEDLKERQQSNGWIPCEGRLPDKDGIYLATIDGEIAGEDKPFVGLAEFENGKWIDDEDDYQCILAWQPLPEPSSN